LPICRQLSFALEKSLTAGAWVSLTLTVLAMPSAALTVAATLATTEEVEMAETVETETLEETRTKETETSEETRTKETETGITSTINLLTTTLEAMEVAMVDPVASHQVAIMGALDPDVEIQEMVMVDMEMEMVHHPVKMDVMGLDVVIQEMVIMDMAMVHHQIVTDALVLDVVVQGMEMVDMDHPMAILQVIMGALDLDVVIQGMAMADMPHPMGLPQVIMDAQDLHVGEEMVAMEGPTIFPPATMVDVVDLDVEEVAAATADPRVAAVVAVEETKEVENLPLSNGSQGLLILGEGGGVLQTTKPLLPAI